MDYLPPELVEKIWVGGAAVVWVGLGFLNRKVGFMELFLILVWPVVLVFFAGYLLVLSLGKCGVWLGRIWRRSRRGW